MKIALGSSEGVVELFIDRDGRDELIECLKELEFPENSTSHEHFHLFTEDWGAHGLVVLNNVSCKKFGLEPVHHLKVSMRPSKKDVWR